MNKYTHKNLPKSGTAKRIWDVIGEELQELHYNANNYGRGKVNGWGTWACTFKDGYMAWCGADDKGVYIEQMRAPYGKKYVKELVKK